MVHLRITRLTGDGGTREAAHRLLISLATSLGAEAVGLDHRSDGSPSILGMECSLSWSGELVAAAVAPPGIPVGVDIEPRRTIPDRDLVAWEFLPLALAGGVEDDASFLRAWTTLEASLKAGRERLGDRARFHKPRPHRTVMGPELICTVAVDLQSAEAAHELECLHVDAEDVGLTLIGLPVTELVRR